MARWTWWLAVLLILCISPALPAQDGRLQTIRNEVRADPPADSSSDKGGKSRRADGSCDPDDDDNPFGQRFTLGVVGILFASTRDYLFFPRYPYADGLPGFEQTTQPTEALLREGGGPALKTWDVRLSLENGNDFDGVNRLGGQVLFEAGSHFGLSADWNWLHERLPCGCTDDLVLGDVNLDWRLINSNRFLLRGDLGLRILADRSQANFGLNAGLGADFFPVKPLVFSGVFDTGWVGEAAVLHGRLSVGVIHSGWEIYAGYDYLAIGSVHIQGPMLGVRYWF